MDLLQQLGPDEHAERVCHFGRRLGGGERRG
jgi:hypothetical protein